MKMIYIRVLLVSDRGIFRMEIGLICIEVLWDFI